MGYSTNKQTLEDFRSNLMYLEQGKEQVWLTEVGEAAKVAYKIRECLYIARLYKDQYPGLAAASEGMVIEVIAPNKVQARRVRTPTEAVLATQGGEDKPHESPITGTQDHRRRAGLATSGPQTAFTVMDVWKQAQPSNDPIFFPDAALDDTNLTLLYNWATKRTPRLMLLVDGPALTLGVAEPEVEQYSWRPNATS